MKELGSYSIESLAAMADLMIEVEHLIEPYLAENLIELIGIKQLHEYVINALEEAITKEWEEVRERAEK